MLLLMIGQGGGGGGEVERDDASVLIHVTFLASEAVLQQEQEPRCHVGDIYQTMQTPASPFQLSADEE